jgi:hypothetical protein
MNNNLLVTWKFESNVEQSYIRGIALKPHPIYPGPCSIDVTDLADIFTVDRANIFRKKPKISAQTDQPVWRYIGHNY